MRVIVGTFQNVDA